MGESHSCPCWEVGTLAKAGGAEIVRKGETVPFTLTLSPKTAKGQSRLAQGQRWQGFWDVYLLYQVLSLPCLAGKSLAVSTAVRLQGIARLLIIWC